MFSNKTLCEKSSVIEESCKILYKTKNLEVFLRTNFLTLGHFCQHNKLLFSSFRTAKYIYIISFALIATETKKN